MAGVVSGALLSPSLSDGFLEHAMPYAHLVQHARLLAGAAFILGATARNAQSQAKNDKPISTSTAPTRLYRRSPSSSTLTAPRVFARVFCEPGTLLRTVRFYEALTRTKLDQDMDIPSSGLHVVAVGPFLILAIDRTKLARADEAMKTHVTVLVANLDEAIAEQTHNGATIVQARWNAPPGPGVRLRHPDGTLVEYVEHRPSAFDAETPGPMFR